MRRFLGQFCVFAAFLTACMPDSAHSTNRADAIGSTSLCADSYLITLAPERAQALSWQAGSPLSTANPKMNALPRLWPSREVLAQTNLSLLTGPGDATFGRAESVSLQWGEDFEAVANNAEKIAERFQIDVSDLIQQIERLDTLPKPTHPVRILYLSRSGGSAGPGTFVDAAIRAAGGTNVNETVGWHTPAVERILQFEPDLIVTSFFGSDYAGVSDRAVRHSALRRYLAARPTLEIPGKLWPCAGPGLIDATQRINAAILAL